MPLVLLAALLFLGGCSAERPGAAAPAGSSPQVPVSRLLASLTLEQKLGQRIMTEVPGTVVADDARRLVVEGGLGGCIVTQQNIVDPGQLAAYTAALQAAARGSPTGIGLLVAVDQEGGRVNRFRSFATFAQFPAAWYAGAAADPAYLEAEAYVMARDLASVGILVNLAPVLDLYGEPDKTIVGDRALGADPATVGRLGAAFVRGTSRAGGVAVAKHFPGHGATTEDSHATLPIVDLTPGKGLDAHLAPFRDAIGAGLEAIMTAHIVYPALDPAAPASLSAPIIRKLLRRDLGFDGVVISDGIEMKAVRERYALDDLLARLFAADVDIILARDLYDADTLVAALARLVAEGMIATADVDRGTARVLELKRRHGLLPATKGATP